MLITQFKGCKLALVSVLWSICSPFALKNESLNPVYAFFPKKRQEWIRKATQYLKHVIINPPSSNPESFSRETSELPI